MARRYDGRHLHGRQVPNLVRQLPWRDPPGRFGNAFVSQIFAERTRQATMLEPLLALRDAAGLAWGGVEMSSNENGDFMHFDCRNDPFGKAVYDHARKNKKAAKAD